MTPASDVRVLGVGPLNLGALLTDPRVTLGTWNQIAAPEIVDLIGWNGFDYAIIDCEHGPFGIAEAERQGRACLAAGLASAIRIARNDPIAITQALDAGLGHVVVPNVGSGAEAAAAVAAARFAPEGTRGACPCVRSAGHFTTDWPTYVAAQTQETGIIALVESTAGVAAFDDILGTDGLGAVMFGPFDLSVSMGLDGDWRADAVQAAIEGMTATAVTRGCPVVMPLFSTDAEECRRMLDVWQARGVRSFVIGSDKIILATPSRVGRRHWLGRSACIRCSGTGSHEEGRSVLIAGLCWLS